MVAARKSERRWKAGEALLEVFIVPCLLEGWPVGPSQPSIFDLDAVLTARIFCTAVTVFPLAGTRLRLMKLMDGRDFNQF